jgi:hypothetical protein
VDRLGKGLAPRDKDGKFMQWSARKGFKFLMQLERVFIMSRNKTKFVFYQTF